MLDTALNIVGDEAQKMSGPLYEALNAQKASFQAIVQAKLEGELSDEEVLEELEREKALLEVELITIEIVAKSTVQKAVNAAISCLSNALLR